MINKVLMLFEAQLEAGLCVVVIDFLSQGVGGRAVGTWFTIFMLKKKFQGSPVV